jgi:hypothetical protein
MFIPRMSVSMKMDEEYKSMRFMSCHSEEAKESTPGHQESGSLWQMSRLVFCLTRLCCKHRSTFVR